MSGDCAQGTVNLAIEGGIATITLHRPRALNAITWSMYRDFARHCETVQADRTIACVVLRGHKRAFAAGTDISQFSEMTSGDDGVKYEEAIEKYVSAFEELPVPTIAVVEGVATGAGLVLANACDLRIATEGSRFGAPIARTVGNCLSARNLHRLTCKLGPNIVSSMMFRAILYGPADLPRSYARIVTDAGVEEAVAQLCADVQRLCPTTLAATKQALLRLRQISVSDVDIVERVYASANFREGVQAFLAKRPPHWVAD